MDRPCIVCAWFRTIDFFSAARTYVIDVHQAGAGLNVNCIRITQAEEEVASVRAGSIEKGIVSRKTAVRIDAQDLTERTGQILRKGGFQRCGSQILMATDADIQFSIQSESQRTTHMPLNTCRYIRQLQYRSLRTRRRDITGSSDSQDPIPAGTSRLYRAIEINVVVGDEIGVRCNTKTTSFAKRINVLHGMKIGTEQSIVLDHPDHTILLDDQYPAIGNYRHRGDARKSGRHLTVNESCWNARTVARRRHQHTQTDNHRQERQPVISAKKGYERTCCEKSSEHHLPFFFSMFFKCSKPKHR